MIPAKGIYLSGRKEAVGSDVITYRRRNPAREIFPDACNLADPGAGNVHFFHLDPVVSALLQGFLTDPGKTPRLETNTTPDRTIQIAAADIIATTVAVGSYVVQDGDENTTGLTVKSLSVTGGGIIKDAALNATSGHAITGTNLNAYDFKVETTAPTIGTITSTAADGSYGIGAAIPAVVTFINGIGGAAENVNLNSGTFDITLATGGAGTAVSISSDWNGSTATGNYVVAEGETSSDLSASGLAIGGGGAVTDSYGNELSATPAIPAGANMDDAEAIVIDGTRPTIASITSSTADGTYAIGDDINVTITFSEPVVLATATLDLVLNSGITLGYQFCCTL